MGDFDEMSVKDQAATSQYDMGKTTSIKTKGGEYSHVSAPKGISHKVGGAQAHTRHGKGAHPDDMEPYRKDKHLDEGNDADKIDYVDLGISDGDADDAGGADTDKGND